MNSVELDENIAMIERALDDNEVALSQKIDGIESLALKRSRLWMEANNLELANRLLAWSKRTQQLSDESMRSFVTQLYQLQEILMESSHSSKKILDRVWKEEFEPLFQFASTSTLRSLRQELQENKYPSDCESLLDEWESGGSDTPVEAIVENCKLVADLSSLRLKVLDMDRISDILDLPKVDLTAELCRLIVERVKYHFVEDEAGNVVTERLPELLWNYFRQSIFESGAWELIEDVIAPSIPSSTNLKNNFINEIVRMMQWVMAEKDFFRNDSVAGLESKPFFLSNAVHSLLAADSYLRDLVEDKSRIVSLVDSCVAADDEMLLWWLDCERTAVLSIFCDTDLSAVKVAGSSPRTELFVSLLKSLVEKASVFAFSGPYLYHVAEPLCQEFLEAVQGTADDLKIALQARSRQQTDAHLVQCITRWIELVHGITDAEKLLMASGQEELENFGRALGSFHEAAVQELALAYVELMERAKLASYMMRCSSFIAENTTRSDQFSPELEDTRRMLILLDSCTAKVASTDTANEIQSAVLANLAHKFLVVVLNDDGITTPDLVREGCEVLKNDVEHLFVMKNLPPSSLRLLDAVRLASSSSSSIRGLGNALCDLSGYRAPLEVGHFDDDALLNEAMSMIQAKGWVWMELDDVLSILNRRRDLHGAK